MSNVLAYVSGDDDSYVKVYTTEPEFIEDGPVSIDVGDGYDEAQVTLSAEEAQQIGIALLCGAAEIKPITTAPVVEEQPQDTEAVLRDAADDGATVSFHYRKPDGTRTHRTIDVESVYRSDRGHLLVSGYQDDADDYRCFRVDRIEGKVTI